MLIILINITFIIHHVLAVGSSMAGGGAGGIHVKVVEENL